MDIQGQAPVQYAYFDPISNFMQCLLKLCVTHIKSLMALVQGFFSLFDFGLELVPLIELKMNMRKNIP